MQQVIIEDKVFDNLSFKRSKLKAALYENCSFVSCDFENSDLAEFKFTDCTFTGCNLSLASLGNTAFRYVQFNGSKLMGVNFEKCSKLGLSLGFNDCILDNSAFTGLNIKNTVFTNCRLFNADFTSAEMENSVFNNCDLKGAVFFKTGLKKADLTTSVNYIIDPELNRISKAKFSLTGLPGLLAKFELKIEFN